MTTEEVITVFYQDYFTYVKDVFDTIKSVKNDKNNINSYNNKVFFNGHDVTSIFKNVNDNSVRNFTYMINYI